MKVVCGSLIFTGFPTPTPSIKTSSRYLCMVCNRICEEETKQKMKAVSEKLHVYPA